MSTAKKQLTPSIKIGVIGVGKMGQYHCNLLSQWKTHDVTVNFVGISDPNQELGKKCAKQYQTSFFDDVLDLLNEVDAVIVAASTSAHFSIAKLVLENKKHLLIEKPITEDLKQAKELFELAKKNHLVLQIGLVERYNACMLALKNYTDSPLRWESKRMAKKSNRTFYSGVCTDLMIHDVDLFFQFCGKHVKDFSEINISTKGKQKSVKRDEENHTNHQIDSSEDTVIAQITIPQKNQTQGNILASFVASREYHQQERSLSLSQKSNTIKVDFDTQEMKVFSDDSTKTVDIKKNNALQLEIKDFLTKVKHGFDENHPIDYSRDLLVLECVLEIQKQV